MDRTNGSSFFTMAAVAGALQLLCVLGYIPVMSLGPKPETAQAYFQIFQTGWLAGLLRGDMLSTILVALYLGIAPGLFLALRGVHPGAAFMAAMLTVIAAINCITTDSALSLFYLSKQYAAAADPGRQVQLLAAGEAIIAGDMWHSTASFLMGIFLQGSGVIFSILMLRGSQFSKATALFGLAANGLDLLQHLLHIAFPEVSAAILTVAGVLYLPWFPLLVRDFLRLRAGAR